MKRKQLPGIFLVAEVLVLTTLFWGSIPTMAQHPDTLAVSDVVVGPQKLETRYALVIGKWSWNLGSNVSIDSTEIHCYKAFGFCEVATAYTEYKMLWVNLDTFDIVRWDDDEMIAVSSGYCIEETLRLDFVAKRVSLSEALISEKKSHRSCRKVTVNPTGFLIGLRDEEKQMHTGRKQDK